MATIDLRGATVSAADPPIGANPNPDLAIKAPVRVATTGGNITLSGLQTIDGVALASGDRVLVKDQTDTTTNGLYNVATGPWTRTIDALNNSQFTQGMQVAVTQGQANAGAAFTLATANPIVLGTSPLTFTCALAVVPPALSTSPGLVITQNAGGLSALPSLGLNQINITDTVNAGGNFCVGLNVNYVYGGPSCQGGREAVQATMSLNVATSPSNPNRNYVGVVGVGEAIANDNGAGVTTATALGAVFGGNFVGALFAGATNFLNVTGAEFNSFVQTGASAALKSLLQVSADPRDRVQGSVVDAMFWAYNQSGSSPGWNNGILIDNAGGIGAWPIAPAGTVIKTGGAGAAALGIDLSNTTFSTAAFKSAGFTVDGAGNVKPAGINIGSSAASFGVSIKQADSSSGQVLFAGSAAAIRFWTDATGGGNARIEAVDNTGVASFKPLFINATAMQFTIGGTVAQSIFSSGGVGIGSSATDPGAGGFLASTIFVNNAAFMLRSKASFTNGAGSSSATLTNAPAAGNPTKWIAIDDNGTTRQIPAW